MKPLALAMGRSHVSTRPVTPGNHTRNFEQGDCGHGTRSSCPHLASVLDGVDTYFGAIVGKGGNGQIETVQSFSSFAKIPAVRAPMAEGTFARSL